MSASMMLRHAVDMAFAHMVGVYGRDFLHRYEGQELEGVKNAWCRELGGCSLDAIAWAQTHLPERPPHAPQFRALCFQAPRPEQMAMREQADKGRLPTFEELDAMRRLRDEPVLPPPSRQWARNVIAKHARGETISTAALRMAQEAIQ